jgi:hypothetical protein
MGGGSERRRGKRIMVQAPVQIRRIENDKPAPFRQEVATNVSLAGVYFETAAPEGYQVNEIVLTSVSVPESSTREFPFTRLAGRSRIVRVLELPGQEQGQKRYGIALEFGDDLTALTALPVRG